MAELTIFRDYALSQSTAGQSLELHRSDDEVVVLAFDQVRQRLVELHVLTALHAKDPIAQPTIAVFQSRLRHLRLLEAPTVITVVDGGVDDESLYYVCDFLDGETLADYLQRTHPLPPWLALHLVRDLLLGATALMVDPSLVREIDWLQSIVHLTGSTTADLHAAVIDVGLTASLASSSPADPGVVVKETLEKLSQLLIFSLTGVVAETIAPTQLAQWPIPAVCRQLLRQWQESTGPSSAVDFSLARREIDHALTRLSPPPTGPIAAALRPRLRLQSLLLDPDELSTRLPSSWRAEITPFDALNPYQQKVFTTDGRTATAQLMPASRIAPCHWSNEVRAVHTAATETTHILKIIDPAVLGAEHYLEAAVCGPTLRQWHSATPADGSLVKVAPLIHELARAVSEAEKSGLSWMRVTPDDIFLTPHEVTKDDAFDWLTLPPSEWPAWRWIWRLHPCLRQWVETPVLPEPMTPRQHIESLVTWIAGSPATWPATLQRFWAENDVTSVSAWIEGLASAWPQPIKTTPEPLTAPSVDEPTASAHALLDEPATEEVLSDVETQPLFATEVSEQPINDPVNPIAALMGFSAPAESLFGSEIQYPLWPAFRREDEDIEENDDDLSATAAPGVGEMINRGALAFSDSWPPAAADEQALSFSTRAESIAAPWLRNLIVVIVLTALMIAFMLYLTGSAPWLAR